MNKDNNNDDIIKKEENIDKKNILECDMNNFEKDNNDKVDEVVLNKDEENLNEEKKIDKVMEEKNNAKNGIVAKNKFDKEKQKANYSARTVVLSVLSASLFTGVLINEITNNKIRNMQTEIVVVNDDTESISRAVAKKAIPSVVGINTLAINSNNIFSIPEKSEGIGSGIIINSKGYILTNFHVLQDDNIVEKISIYFSDGDIKEGKILWKDEQLDLAIIKVENKENLIPAKLGDSDKVEVGDNCYALGNPLGLEFAGTLTKGIISGKDRKIDSSKGMMNELIQTDASINPGNSGGPLLNNKGEVIGINTAKISNAESLGFSIPINVAKPIIEQVIKNGSFERATLGIKGMDVETFKSLTGVDLSAKEGVYVLEVIENSAAKKSGINMNDIIIKIGDKDIKTMIDLNKELYNYSKGQKIDIVVLRNGDKTKMEVKFN